MSGSFTVGALAVAAREANAVGAVRLTLLPRKLEVELLRAGSFSDGYVPGGLTRFVRFSVPYTAVRGLVRRSRGVLLSLDPAVATPHNRFFLTHFTDLPLEALAATHRRRSVARALAWLVPLPVAAWAATHVPAELASGTLGRASVGALVLMLFALLLTTFAAWLETGGPLSKQLRDALERKLSQRMGFEPTSFHETEPFEIPEIAELDRRTRLGLARAEAGITVGVVPAPPVDLAAQSARESFEIGRERALPPPAPAATEPRSFPPPETAQIHVAAPGSHALPPQRVVDQRPAPSFWQHRFTPFFRVSLVTGTLATIATLGALFGARLVQRVKPAEPVSEPADEAPVDEPEPAPAAVAEAPACSCERADSPLWRTGLPALTLLPIPRSRRGEAAKDTIAPTVDAGGVSRYDFDIAIVNNAAISLSDVRVVVTFARRNVQGERVGAKDRGLFWEGELRPARSVKWSVSGPGTEVKIEMDEQRMLSEVGVAPAEAFAKLERARQPAVRLHAAMMLAYLGDERATRVLATLPEPSAVDAITRDRILRAMRPLKLCEVKLHKTDLEACAFNGTAEPLSGAVITPVTADGSGKPASIPDALAPKTGVRVSIPGFGGDFEELELTAP